MFTKNQQKSNQKTEILFLVIRVQFTSSGNRIGKCLLPLQYVSIGNRSFSLLNIHSRKWVFRFGFEFGFIVWSVGVGFAEKIHG
ncbi:hypothetical protein CRYUN_Cryun11dG0027500 [Craigia yunnanensis]